MTFHTVSDDGVRLWVDGKLVIDNFTDHAALEDTGTVTLTAGQKYDIRVAYRENGGEAVVKLFWSSPCQTREIVSALQLYPTGFTGPFPTVDAGSEAASDAPVAADATS